MITSKFVSWLNFNFFAAHRPLSEFRSSLVFDEGIVLLKKFLFEINYRLNFE